MPRGQHPNSRANLIVNSERTPKERQEQARKAGQKSGEVRSEMASLSADLKEQCTPERITKINKKILDMAERGNLRAFELIRDTIGEKPKDRQEHIFTETNGKLDSIMSQLGGEELTE